MESYFIISTRYPYTMGDNDSPRAANAVTSCPYP